MKFWRSGVAALAAVVGLASGSAADAWQKRIYIANDDHTDFVWTADADTYAHVFVDMLDWHLKLADETSGNPVPYRNRFNADGSYWLWNYEQTKTPAEFARLIERVKDGTIGVPLNTLVSCYGGQPVEAVLRGMYYAGRLERRHRHRFPIAIAMENQTLPLGLASLFAGAGAKYSWRGVCGCATRVDKAALKQRPREVYWWQGHDGQRLLLKWYSWAMKDLGGYWEAGKPVENINLADTDPRFLKLHSDPKTGETFKVVGIFGFGGDDLARKTGVPPPPETPEVPGLQKVVSSPYCDHFHIIAQQQSNETRQVIVSNELDFFEDFERTHGETIDTQSVTFGNEWDLYSASMSETSARAKRAVEQLRPAELLAALVSLKYPDFMKRHTAARDRAFHALGLYWEHNWTADGPVSRPQRAAWQEQVVGDIEYYVQSVFGEGVVRLGGMIPRPKGAERFFVLNPLGWRRTEPADFAYNGPHDIHVRDLETGQEVPHQLVRLQGAQYLRILASEVPATGYKVFAIEADNGARASSPPPTTESGSMPVRHSGTDTLENELVKIVMERDGAIRSFIDKVRGNTELAATIGGLKLNDMAEKSDDGDPLRVENVGPVSVTVRARSAAGLDHTTAITLYHGSDRVDISNEINVNFADVRYWAFSFALDQPAVRTEEVGGINLNKPKAAGGDYADTHARYDHITVNHFADITDGTGTRGLTISNPDLAFARLGNSTPEHLDIKTPQLNLLAGGQVDGPALGIRAQNGNAHFLQRFAIRPHGGYDQAAAMRFALEHQNPFVTGAVISKEGGAYPEISYSLLSVSNPDVLLWALKPHEDGIEHGLVARLWNLSDAPAEAELALTPGIASAHRTTHIETDLEAVPLKDSNELPASFSRQQIQSYRIQIP